MGNTTGEKPVNQGVWPGSCLSAICSTYTYMELLKTGLRLVCGNENIKRNWIRCCFHTIRFSFLSLRKRVPVCFKRNSSQIWHGNVNPDNRNHLSCWHGTKTKSWISVFRDAASCNVVDICGRIEEHVASIFVMWDPDFTASHSRGQHTSYSPPWEPRISQTEAELK
jgi:hypothetical protein